MFFLFFGILFAVFNNQIYEETISYSDSCSKLNSDCRVSFDLSAKVSSPLYVFYEITNFYQNQLAYLQSASKKQLEGEYQTLEQAVDCSEAKTNRQMEKTQSFTGKDLSPDEVATPCGMIAKTMFNGLFMP